MESGEVVLVWARECQPDAVTYLESVTEPAARERGFEVLEDCWWRWAFQTWGTWPAPRRDQFWIEVEALVARGTPRIEAERNAFLLLNRENSEHAGA